MSEAPPAPPPRAEYRAQLQIALCAAEQALALARAHGWRTDCLADAARSLAGALNNVRFEDDAAHRAQEGTS